MKKRPFPRRVSIENTNACNARCSICPREKLRRKIEFMDMETYRKLLNDSIEAGATRLSLHNFGEPVLDKQLADKIAYAREQGIEETYIVTNASLLTREKAKELIQAGLDRIKISFYGINREEYSKIHVGLDYDTTLENVKGLLETKKELGTRKPKIQMRYIGSPVNYLRFRKQWSDYRGLCSILPGKLHNYSTGRNYNPIAGIKRPNFMKSCRYLKRSVVYILVNGDVVPCCYDFNGKLVMGNALEEKVGDIWNGEKFQAFRKAHKEHRFEEYPLCAACDKLNYIFI